MTFVLKKTKKGRTRKKEMSKSLKWVLSIFTLDKLVLNKNKLTNWSLTFKILDKVFCLFLLGTKLSNVKINKDHFGVLLKKKSVVYFLALIFPCSSAFISVFASVN